MNDSSHRQIERTISNASEGSASSHLTAPHSIRLGSLSPSPSSRRRGAQSSEDEDEHDYAPSGEDSAQTQPLVRHRRHAHAKAQRSKKLWQRGGVGHFLFHTPAGQQTYIGLLVFWVGGCQFGTLLINRFILWTGTYKFPYPLTLTLLQLIIAHLMLIGFANFTRITNGPLHSLGLGGIVAPSEPSSRGQQGYRRPQGTSTFWTKLVGCMCPGTGGIAGTGLLAFDLRIVRRLSPLAVIFFARLVLSNISYAYDAPVTI